MSDTNNFGFDSMSSVDDDDLFDMFNDEAEVAETDGASEDSVDDAWGAFVSAETDNENVEDDNESVDFGHFDVDDASGFSGASSVVEINTDEDDDFWGGMTDEQQGFGNFDFSAEPVGEPVGEPQFEDADGTEETSDGVEIAPDVELNEELFDTLRDDFGGDSAEVDLSSVDMSEDYADEDDSEIGEVSASALRGQATPSKEFDIDDMYVDRGTSSFGGLLESRTDEGAFDFKRIEVTNITVANNRIRKVFGLDKLVMSIQNEGLLIPITVAPTKTDGIYVLVDGLRRLLACAKVGMKNIPCVINHSVSVPEICIVEALSNHHKEYTIQEMLDYIEYVKKEKGIQSSTMIEHLLNMDSGDYNKLMDLVEDDDSEILTPLFGGQMSIQQAFKKLEQKRKKLGKEEKDTARAGKIYSNIEEYGIDRVQGSGDTAEDNDGNLTEAEINEIVNSLGNIDDITEDGESLREEGDNIAGFKPHKQDPGERERLDPKLRKAVLARDDNTCKICEKISGQEYTEVLDVHHIVEVYLGGNDDINNLITACTCCHKLVHLWGRGELHVRPFEEMEDAEAKKFKRIIKLGNIIRKGMAARGMKREELKKMDRAETIGRRLKGSSDQIAG